MTDILCSWLNEDIKLERSIDKESFEDEFANGYLIGEILSKHGLQEDFGSFSKGKSSESKLANFMKLEPSLRLIQVPFDTNTIHDIIAGRKGAATKLLYQVYIALKKKKRNQLSSQTMEVMRPQARARLERIQTDSFQQRLKQQVPRQVDLTFKQLIDKFEEQRRKQVDLIAKQELLEEQKVVEKRKAVCRESLDKDRQTRATQAEMYKKLKPLDPPTKELKVHASRGVSSSRDVKEKMKKKKKMLETTMKEIAEFEESHNLSPPKESSSSQLEGTQQGKKLMTTTDDDYVSEIKARVREDASARRDRNARRRKLLVDQMKLIKQKEDEEREKAMADRLMRQSLQEKRIATQLMQIRKEKDNIRNNRIERQKQYEEERNRMFQQALDREAVMIAREREEQKIMLKAQKERRKAIMLQRAREHYEKHYSLAMGVIKEIVMLAVKIGEYKELTEGSIPDKLVRDWKFLFVKGKPLYEEEESLMGSISSSQGSVPADTDGDDILDNEDLKEYLKVFNEWSPNEPIPNEPIPNLPGEVNPVLTHIVHRLIELVMPPQIIPSPPPFPKFQFKGSFLGLPYTGKTTTLNKLSEELGIVVVCPSVLVKKALEAYQEERVATPVDEEETEKENGETKGEGKPPPVSTVEIKLPDNENSKNNSGSNNGGDTDDTTLQEQPLIECHISDLVYQLSEIGKLGERVFAAIANGDAVDDETIVDIIIYEIRTLNDESSWILDNYPTTLYQAQLLATGLTGQGASALKEQSDSAKKGSQDFLFMPKREAKEEELLKLSAACGLDLVVHFDVTVDNTLARSAQYQKEIANPPDIQECLLSNDTNWPKVSQWFNQFRVLTVINANTDLAEVSDQAQKVVLEKLSKLKQLEIMKKHGIKLHVDGPPVEGVGLASKSVSKMPKGGGKAAVKEEKTKKSTSSPHMRKRRTSSAGFTRPLWSPDAAKEMTNSEKQPRKSVEETLFELMDPSVQPGTTSWMYHDDPVDTELAHSLSQRWPMAEKAYSSTFKGVFRQLRTERDEVCHYLYNRRKEFSKYLKRPDNKQEFVSQWQKAYNEIQPHLRREDIMKAELHHRVEDLIDKLWDICEGRKKEAEKERENIINDQWLEDKMGIVSNHYISLMNCELVKFQDAVLLLKDYYASMQPDTPIAVLPNIRDRIPLIELPNAPNPADPPSMTSSQQTLTNKPSMVEDKPKVEQEEPDPEKKRRVTLMPREPPVVPDPAAEEKTKRKSTAELIQPPREDISGLELDEQLIVHSYNTAIAAIFKLINSEVGILEAASAEANRPATPTAVTEPKREKSSGKGKKGAKSPSVKKGKSTPKDKKGEAAPTDTPNKTPAVSPAEMAKKQHMERMRKEHKFALRHEENITKARVQLIKAKALEFVTYIKEHSSTLYQKMDTWIGKFYQQEVSSVNQLGEVLRSAIEQESKLKYELVLPGVEFEIHQGVLLYPPTPPPTPPPPREPTHPTQFSSFQLISLFNQLKSLAPSGVITVNNLISFIHVLANKSFGENIFPLMWIGITKDTVSQICHALYGKRAELVQWFRFFQCVVRPYPLPSSADLLAMLEALSDREEGQSAEQLLFTWFNEEDIRERTIRQLLIDAFALLQEEGSAEYTELLFLLCASPSIEEGTVKAFVLADHMESTDQLQREDEDNLMVSHEVLHKVLAYGSYDNHFTKRTTERLYRNIKAAPTTTAPVPLDIVLQDESMIEALDTCVNYQLPPDVALFINRPSSVEPPPTPSHAGTET